MRPGRAGLVLSLLAALLAALLVTLGSAPVTAGTAQTLVESDRRYPARVEGVFKDGVGPGRKFRPGPDVVAFAGRLTAVGAPLEGQTLVLERRPAGSTVWTGVGSETTDAEGEAVFRTPVTGNADYRIVFPGDMGYPPAEGVTMPQRAMRDLNAVMVKKNGKVFLEGDINPGWEGKRVAWERRTCSSCRWKRIARADAGPDGEWRFQAAYPPTGEKHYYRATLRATEEFVTSRSAVLRTVTLPGRPGHRTRWGT